MEHKKIELPAPGSKIYFKNYQRKQPVPFIIYADFEALTKKIKLLVIRIMINLIQILMKNINHVVMVIK